MTTAESSLRGGRLPKSLGGTVQARRLSLECMLEAVGSRVAAGRRPFTACLTSPSKRCFRHLPTVSLYTFPESRMTNATSETSRLRINMKIIDAIFRPNRTPRGQPAHNPRSSIPTTHRCQPSPHLEATPIPSPTLTSRTRSVHEPNKRKDLARQVSG